ncbi:unnamed protein product [Rhizoctonia solani]|uniref:Cell wall protein n=1 Tax=Rhizoctonia solani TaxID=456999 RepID=A0A8H3GQQ2_9AGAM|nr:unnamed protein product [Rhizoctonia solani]
MFFTHFVVTALSFSATALAAPIDVAGVALPVDASGLLPDGSSLPIDASKLPLPDLNGIPLPVVGGFVPSLGSGGVGLPLARRGGSTFNGALDNLDNVAGRLLNNLNGARGLDASSLVSGLDNLNDALGIVNSALRPLQGMGVDSLLAGASLDDVTEKTQSAFQLVNQVTSKVQSMGLASEAKDQMLTTVKTLNDITSGLGIAPELQSAAKGCLAKVLGLVGGPLGGLGINL